MTTSYPFGMLKVHGRPVNPGAIKRTALLTVEGERDDICGLGQTLAAQELCMGLLTFRRELATTASLAAAAGTTR
jgi:poly-beta-hydroxyalkanoate depolymerase